MSVWYITDDDRGRRGEYISDQLCMDCFAFTSDTIRRQVKQFLEGDYEKIAFNFPDWSIELVKADMETFSRDKVAELYNFTLKETKDVKKNI